MKIEIRNPVALKNEIEKVIHVHYGIQEHMSFMEEYPEVYHIYRALKGATPPGNSARCKNHGKS